jgi:phenylacetate-CoA ligase
MAVIGDPRGFPTRIRFLSRLGIVRRRYVSIFADVERQLKVLEAFQPDVVKSYSSSITMLAAACRDMAHRVTPRLIFTSAEVLGPGSRKLLQSVFGAEVFDNYACYEFGLLGWECRDHVGYHRNVDSVVMEFLKDGEPVTVGERGEIVCTGLANRVMPLIRYKTGDVGGPLEEPCSCSVTLPRMRILEGRADDFLTTIDGKLVSPTVFFPYPFEEADFRGIAQFRIIQETRDKLVIVIALRNGFQHEDAVLQNAEQRIQQLFGAAMQVEFRIVEDLRRDPSGKLRKVISHVPVTFGSSPATKG